MQEPENTWSVYILRCADGSLYTGIAKDTARRLQQHNRGVGAKYTRSRRPVELVYRTSCASRSEALSREYAIKQMSVRQKREMIDSYGDAGPATDST
jgi:predicted GIY-YIG superfamily endonuclease